MTDKIRTRFAPSPTGNLHIGGIRTALYCYALAHKTKGEYLVRVEDTDKKRFVAGSIEEMIEVLELYKLPPHKTISEGDLEKVNAFTEEDLATHADWILHPDKFENIDDKDYEDVMVQSLRLPLYQKYAYQLLNEGFAYCCFCSSERLKSVREAQQATKEKPKYDGLCKKFTLEEALVKIEAGENFTVRLNADAYKQAKKKTEIEYTDVLMGDMIFPLEEVDDQVIMKSNGIPTYHLAVVVDDYLMKITHPMRATEWIPSTPKQIMVYDMLGWPMPPFTHVTAILSPKGGKLSKRDGSVAAKDFLAEGYLPEAVLNFLMFLGWSPPEERKHGEAEREFFTLQEFVELFDLKDLNRSNPVFNRDKLDWFNQKYISKLSPDNFVLKFTAWLKDYGENWTNDNIDKESLTKLIEEKDPDYLESVLVLIQERIKLLSEVPDSLLPFYIAPQEKAIQEEYDNVKQTKKLSDEQIASVVSEFKLELEKHKSIKNWGHENWETFVRALAEKLELKAGQTFMILRIATLGTPFSPPLFESMEVLGREEILSRLG